MIILFWLIVFIPFNLFAKDFPDIFGCFCEGGIITGRVESKDQVITIDDKRIRVSEDGDFIFAFGRKFKESITISVNGINKKYEIKDKKYKKEIIRGLPSRKVEPNKEDIKQIKSDQKKIKLVKRVGETKKLFDKTFLIPVDGRISGVYGSQRILNSKPRSTHKGIDIAAPKGTKIYAPSTGRITLIEEDMFFTGKTVIVDHGMGLISIFAHLNSIYIRPGQFVEKGMEIGEVGMSGRATGPHLHWGVYLENISVDPMALLEFKFTD